MNRALFSFAGQFQRAGGARPRAPMFGSALSIVLLAILLMPGPGLVSRARAETRHAVMAPRAPRSLLLDAAAVGGRICAVGERGHVLLSDDSGQTWRQVRVPTRANLTGVTFQGSKLGWAVGHDAVILRTLDGGESWEKVYADPDGDRPLLDVWFGDPKNGFALGAYGLCLRTVDGGRRWHPMRVSPDDWHLHQMARSAEGRLYIAAEAGQIYRSDDDGATWTSLPSPYDGSFFGVMPLDGEALMVFGLRGHVFYSVDAGLHWQLVPTGTVATLADGIRLSDGRFLLAGLAGTVLVSRSLQDAFKPVPGPGRLGIWAVLETEKPGLVCFGERGATPLPLPK